MKTFLDFKTEGKKNIPSHVTQTLRKLNVSTSDILNETEGFNTYIVTLKSSVPFGEFSMKAVLANKKFKWLDVTIVNNKPAYELVFEQ